MTKPINVCVKDFFDNEINFCIPMGSNLREFRLKIGMPEDNAFLVKQFGEKNYSDQGEDYLLNDKDILRVVPRKSYNC